jgi:hypothetical protein
LNFNTFPELIGFALHLLLHLGGPVDCNIYAPQLAWTSDDDNPLDESGMTAVGVLVEPRPL